MQSAFHPFGLFWHVGMSTMIWPSGRVGESTEAESVFCMPAYHKLACMKYMSAAYCSALSGDSAACPSKQSVMSVCCCRILLPWRNGQRTHCPVAAILVGLTCTKSVSCWTGACSHTKLPCKIKNSFPCSKAKSQQRLHCSMHGCNVVSVEVAIRVHSRTQPTPGCNVPDHVLHWA